MSQKTMVITGGAGFLGSHLVNRFLARNWKVIVLDNLITGREENLAPYSRHPDFAFHKADVTKPIVIEEPVHTVLHFASPASPADYQKFPIQTLKVGALGTHNVLGLAKSKKAVFLLASTSEVYGDPLVHPQSEDYWGNVNPVGPRGVYDEAKRFAEALTLAYHREHGIDTKISRIFNTYGPGMRLRDGRAIPNFISQALLGESLTIYGEGSQTRSFCYIEDLVEGIEKLLYSGVHEPINLGNPMEMTIRELARCIIRLSGSKSEIVARAMPKDDPKCRRPDISRAKRLIDWEPKVSLEEGLKKTIEWFRIQLSRKGEGFGKVKE